MKLYHGTSTRYLDKIIAEGIKPRGRNGGNWKHSVRSHSRAVYLTNAYALHFAQAACKGSDKLVVLEIDSIELDILRFAPDEDFLEQASRNHPDYWEELKSLTQEQRTEWFKKRALKQFAPSWQNSLKSLGNCAYYGIVPSNVIKRVAILSASSEIALSSDPSVTLMSYALLGPYYRNLMKRVFDDKNLEKEEIAGFREAKYVSREGIKVETLETILSFVRA